MKIYAYLEDKMVRAIRADGEPIASITADDDTEDQQNDIAMAVMLAGAPTADLVWVDSPQDHPVLSQMVQRQDDLLDEQRMEQASDQDEEAKMQALRAELHICPTCACSSVCQISHAVNASPEAFVTVSACLTYTPKEENR